jgi:hypothetical protein
MKKASYLAINFSVLIVGLLSTVPVVAQNRLKDLHFTINMQRQRGDGSYGEGFNNWNLYPFPDRVLISTTHVHDGPDNGKALGVFVRPNGERSCNRVKARFTDETICATSVQRSPTSWTISAERTKHDTLVPKTVTFKFDFEILDEGEQCSIKIVEGQVAVKDKSGRATKTLALVPWEKGSIYHLEDCTPQNLYRSRIFGTPNGFLAGDHNSRAAPAKTEGKEAAASPATKVAPVQNLPSPTSVGRSNPQLPAGLAPSMPAVTNVPPPAPAVVAAPPSLQADPEAAARRDYEATERVATVAAWDLFLARYPKGFYSDLARQQREKLVARETAKSSPMEKPPVPQTAARPPEPKSPSPAKTTPAPAPSPAAASPQPPAAAKSPATVPAAQTPQFACDARGCKPVPANCRLVRPPAAGAGQPIDTVVCP